MPTPRLGSERSNGARAATVGTVLALLVTVLVVGTATAHAAAWPTSIASYLSSSGLPTGVTPNRPRVLLLGDSTLAAMAWAPESQVTLARLRPNVTLDAMSCRAISAPSCTGRTDPITGVRTRPANALEVLSNVPDGTYDEIVMMIGYDEGWAAFQNSVPLFLAAAKAKHVAHVTWLTFHSNGAYHPPTGMGDASYRSNNILLQQNADASAGYLTLLDWARFADEPAQAGDVQADGAHLTTAGAFALGELITDAVLQIWGTVLSSNPAATAHPQRPTTSGGFELLSPPVRLVDTRVGTGVDHPGLLAAGQSLRVQLPGPAAGSVIGATVNVTVTRPVSDGYVTAYPCTASPPTASNNDFRAGEDRASTVTVATDADGGFCVFTYSWTDLVVDLMATITTGPSASASTPAAMAPVRVLDTRVGLNGGRLRAGIPSRIPLSPFGVTGRAVGLNVTLVADRPSYVDIYPTDPSGVCGAGSGTSTTNATTPGTAVANRADVPITSGDPAVCALSNNDVDLVLDVTATFSPGASFHPLAPTRLVDTRLGQGGARGTAWRVVVPPSSVVLLSVTGIGATRSGYLAAYPTQPDGSCGPLPGVSTVNPEAGTARANSALVAASTGAVCIGSSATTDLVVDLGGAG